MLFIIAITIGITIIAFGAGVVFYIRRSTRAIEKKIDESMYRGW